MPTLSLLSLDSLGLVKKNSFEAVLCFVDDVTEEEVDDLLDATASITDKSIDEDEKLLDVACWSLTTVKHRFPLAPKLQAPVDLACVSVDVNDERSLLQIVLEFRSNSVTIASSNGLNLSKIWNFEPETASWRFLHSALRSCTLNSFNRELL